MPELTILQGCRTIQLTRGLNTLIDEENWDVLDRYYWQASSGIHTHYACRGHKIGNRRIGVQSTTIRLHRQIMVARSDDKVDHRNGDGLDNRKSNLRIATASQNQRNRRKHVGESRFKGVYRTGNAWTARIFVDGKGKSIGRFATEEDAARAYDLWAHEHYGDFACTNVDIHGDY